MDSSNVNENEFLSLKREVAELKAMLSIPAVKATLEGLNKQAEEKEQDHSNDFARQEGLQRTSEVHGDDPRARAESLVRTYGTHHTSNPNYSPNFPSSPTPSPTWEGRSRRPNKYSSSRRHARSPIRHSHGGRRRRSPTTSSSSSPRRKRSSKKQRTFKAGDKDIKFQTFNGRRNVTKALAFIRQFDVAFVQENFTEKSKLRHVGVYLRNMASDWWLTKILEKRQPRTWKQFKVQFFRQFLPPDFKKDVQKEWDWIHQQEDESVSSYVDEFWATLLKVTPFLYISEEEKMHKFESGLHAPIQKSLKVYPNTTLRRMIESAMVAEELHTKGQPRKQEISTYRAKRKAIHEASKAENAEKNSKQHMNKSDSNKKRKKNGKKPSNKEQGKCFKCGSKDHIKRDCPQGAKKDEVPPTSNAIPDVQGNTTREPRVRNLFKSWGKLEDQNALFLFDPGSTDNFISLEMADALKLKMEQMGVPIEANGAFEGGATHAMPIIGKLRIQVGEYNDKEEFLIAPTSPGYDVLLGMPWHFRVYPMPYYWDKSLSFTFKNKNVTIDASASGSTIPIVNHVAVNKLIKKSTFAYMIFVKEVNSAKAENGSFLEHSNHAFLKKFEDCFLDALPSSQI